MQCRSISPPNLLILALAPFLLLTGPLSKPSTGRPPLPPPSIGLFDVDLTNTAHFILPTDSGAFEIEARTIPNSMEEMFKAVDKALDR